MLDFLKPRHLRYHSVEEWRERENIRSFRHPEKPSLEARLHRQLEELRSHLWKKHLRGLTKDERRQLKEGTHPSQSHKGFEEAKSIFEEFRAKVSALPYVEEVSMTTRHMQPIVFRVKLAQDVSWRVWQERIPSFYRGFEVIVGTAHGRKPALTRENAATLIPNGMSENDVYANLGTNATVSFVNGGHKFLSYLFHFPPSPPKVEPKIDGMTVVIANGRVVDRKFGHEHEG